MKKSKFLQNSKDILSRSFNPIKCKTSLRLASSRLKLLRNKKEVQLKQMKREIAQLLESGQDQTARIRVEHVIREEKMMAAYDLLEIYCELIIARLPIIESQKDCPIDLKEAIASIVFSSPRCGDVPELLDVRKQFSAKYGKEFITAATELRPMCGVGRLLVEKLSAAAPDGQTKIKILNAIAEEHNVKWNQKSFEENDFGRPSPITKESEQHSESPSFEAVVAQARPSYNAHVSQLNLTQPEPKISLGEENLSSGQASGVTTKTQPEANLQDEKMSQLFKGDGYTIQLDSRKSNLEFKDAASAAQAAAESAERASMTARAAAELSSHGMIGTQCSTEPQKSNIYNIKAEGVAGPLNLSSFGKYSEASANKSSSVHAAGLESAEVGGCEPDPVTSSKFEESGGGSQEYSRSASLKFKASGGDDLLYHSSQFAEESEGENMKKESTIYETETSNGWQNKVENLREGKIVKQKSLSISEDVNIFADFENDAEEDPFVNNSKIRFHGEAPETSSHESDALFFDKSDSDVDDHGTDKRATYDEQDLEFHLAQKSLSINTDSWNHRSSSSNVVKSASPPIFFDSENSSPENTILKPDNFAAVTFDDPRGLSDEEMNVHGSVRLPPKTEQHSEIDSKPLSLSSDEDGIPWKRNQLDIFDADSSENPESSFGPEDESTSERLDFGKLTGGFRQKGHNRLPFFKNNGLDVSSVNKEAGTATTIKSSTTLSSTDAVLHHKKSSGKPQHNSESDSDTCEEEEILQKSSPKVKLNFGASKSKFYSDDSDLDEDFSKVSNTRKSHLQSGLSRRTKASSPGKNSMSLRCEALDSNGMDTKANIWETPTVSGANRKSYEQPISVKTKPGKESCKQPKMSNKSSTEPPENSMSLRSEGLDPNGMDTKATTSNILKNYEQPISVKTNPGKVSCNTKQEPKMSTLDRISSNKTETPKKASHVHPKLPDYDALVQSLRINNTL